jgi:hypothetical protein
VCVGPDSGDNEKTLELMRAPLEENATQYNPTHPVHRKELERNGTYVEIECNPNR